MSAAVKPDRSERKIVKASELDVPITVFMAGEDESEEESALPESPAPDTEPAISNDLNVGDPIAAILPPDDEEEGTAADEDDAPNMDRVSVSDFYERKPIKPEPSGINFRSAPYKKGRLDIEAMKKSIPHHGLNPKGKK